MQAAEITPWQRQNGPVCWRVTLFAVRTFHMYAAGEGGSAQRIFCPWWPWPLTLTYIR